MSERSDSDTINAAIREPDLFTTPAMRAGMREWVLKGNAHSRTVEMLLDDIDTLLAITTRQASAARIDGRERQDLDTAEDGPFAAPRLSTRDGLPPGPWDAWKTGGHRGEGCGCEFAARVICTKHCGGHGIPGPWPVPERTDIERDPTPFTNPCPVHDIDTYIGCPTCPQSAPAVTRVDPYGDADTVAALNASLVKYEAKVDGLCTALAAAGIRIAGQQEKIAGLRKDNRSICEEHDERLATVIALRAALTEAIDFLDTRLRGWEEVHATAKRALAVTKTEGT